MTLYEDGPAPGEEVKNFHDVVARQGGWTTTMRVPATTDPAFGVMAFNRPVGAMCTAMYQGTAKRFYAFGACTRKPNSFAALNVSLRDGRPVLRFNADVEKQSRWRVTFRAVLDGVDRHRMDRARADRRGMLEARARLVGDSVSRVRIVATSNNQGRSVFTAGRRTEWDQRELTDGAAEGCPLMPQ